MRDVRMVEGGERLRFARKPRKAIGITSEGVRKDLQRDIAIELGIARPIRLAMPTLADRRGDFVNAEARAGGEGQTLAVARRQGFTNTTRTIASAARQGLGFKYRTSQGTRVGGRVMSGMTSVVIVWVAGAPAKTR